VNERNYSGTYVIWGPPGTGKTTFLATQTQTIVERNITSMGVMHKTPVLICSLTRTAAAEIGGRKLKLPRNQVSTLHSHGYRQLGCPEVAESHWKEWNEHICHEDAELELGEVKDVDTDDPEYERAESAQKTRGQLLLEAYQLNRARMRKRDVWHAEVRRFAKHWEEWKAANEFIDFTDMIERAHDEDVLPPGNPEVVIADEAQDLSRLEYALLKKWGDRAGALMLAGDPYQALYEWRGAHPRIFQDPSLEPERRRILSQSYRVSKAVHQVAMNCAKEMSNYEPIDYRPRDEPGFCRFLEGVTYADPHHAIDLAQEHMNKGETVMFATTCAYMLQTIVGMLRREGVPFANPWRVKRGDWNPLRTPAAGVGMHQRVLDFLRLDEDAHGEFDPDTGEGARPWMAIELHNWIAPLVSKGNLKHGAKKKIERLANEHPEQPVTVGDLYEWMEIKHVESLLTLFDINEFGYVRPPGNPRTPALLDWYAKHLSPRKARIADYAIEVARNQGINKLKERPKLFVGTIHSFKGGEADVTFLFPDISYAGLREWQGGPRARDSILRTFFVGLSRSRQGLYLCEPRVRELSVDLMEFADEYY
jgi:superfamily I DNA/RNA helicase